MSKTLIVNCFPFISFLKKKPIVLLQPIFPSPWDVWNKSCGSVENGVSKWCGISFYQSSLPEIVLSWIGWIGWNMHNDSEEDFLKLYPLGFHLDRRKFPSSKYVLCKVWLKLFKNNLFKKFCWSIFTLSLKRQVF